MFDLVSTHLSTSYLLGAAVVFFVGYSITQSRHVDARIRKLGARAPARTTYLPWGIDIAFDIGSQECPARHGLSDVDRHV